jgi:hypothetical protein
VDDWQLDEPFVSLVYGIRHHSDVAESVYIMEVIYHEGGEATEAIQP